MLLFISLSLIANCVASGYFFVLFVFQDGGQEVMLRSICSWKLQLPESDKSTEMLPEFRLPTQNVGETPTTPRKDV